MCIRDRLAGVSPGEILAITFTRKAAREIEERVVDWLHLLAAGSDEQVLAFLAERGVAVGESDGATIRAARGLYERVLVAQPGLAVNTFHGWFLQLVDAAPLSANLTGATLIESDSRLFDAVSYTHLDVYKRQRMRRARRCSICSKYDALNWKAVRRCLPLLRGATGLTAKSNRPTSAMDRSSVRSYSPRSMRCACVALRLQCC